MVDPVIKDLTDIILHAIAEWEAEYDETDLTIRIRTEILNRFELIDKYALSETEEAEANEHHAAMRAPFSASERRALDAALLRREGLQ